MKTAPSTPMLAFHNNDSIRTKYINRVRTHQEADEIISGTYWENGKGCAVGCSIHGNNHAAYETEIGIPRVLARLEDRLFEAIYKFDPVCAKAWPLRFMSAPKAGANLETVWPKFALWLLLDPSSWVITHAKSERTKASTLRVGALYQQWVDGKKPEPKDWITDAAAAAAADAAAADAAAADAAAAAADAAAAAAAAACRRFYRERGYWPSWRWYYGYCARTETGRARYLGMADKLIELMESAEVSR
jgi:hypothetical protein